MTPHTLLRLYPRAWRERYGDEFVALLEQEGTGPRVVLNVLAGAFDAWVRAAMRSGPGGVEGPACFLNDRDGAVPLRHLRWIAISAGAAFTIYGAAGVVQMAMGPVWWVQPLNQPAAMLGALYGVQATWRLRHFNAVTRAAGAILLAMPFILLAVLVQFVS